MSGLAYRHIKAIDMGRNPSLSPECLADVEKAFRRIRQEIKVEAIIGIRADFMLEDKFEVKNLMVLQDCEA